MMQTMNPVEYCEKIFRECDGPSLDDFLSSDASELPFMNGIEEASDIVNYFIFFDAEEREDHAANLKNDLQLRAEELSKDYIWNGERFRISPSGNSSDSKEELHFVGKTNFGDCIEEEWYIVYILWKLSIEFENEGLCIHLFDDDGDFLLIEAADVIPTCFTPMNSNFRVWIRGGKIHFILPDDETSPSLTLFEGVSQLRRQAKTNTSVASPEMQNFLVRKLSIFSDISSRFHHVRAFLPCGVAAAIERDPSLISLAVKMYCHRNPEQLRQIKKMRFFGSQDYKEARLKFTRHLYAKLNSSAPVYIPFPSSKTFDVSKMDHLDKETKVKAIELGKRVAIGMELLYFAGGRLCGAIFSENTNKCEEEIPERFIQNLQKLKYFDNVTVGSKRYNEKLNLAKEFLERTDFIAMTNSDDEQLMSSFIFINEVLSSDTYQQYPDHLVLEDDDEESWLQVDPNDIENMFTHNINDRESQREKYAASEATKLDEMVLGMNEFIEGKSGLEGAEIPDEFSRITFDVDKLMTILEGTEEDSDVDSVESNESEAYSEINYPSERSVSIPSVNNAENPGKVTELHHEYDSDDEVDGGESNFRFSENSHRFDSPQSDDLYQDSDDECSNYNFRSVEHNDFDINMNMVENILHSFMAQNGQPGPASSLLREMGIGMPHVSH